MLRLVHPQREGKDPLSARRKGTKPAALTLTREEQRHVRAALRNVARAYGGPDVLAIVLEVPRATVYGFCKARSTISGTFAIRLARAAGVSVEAVLTGSVVTAGRCVTCGHRPGAGGGR
ncbi:MAG: helix-turn-helix domain-containing protein [Minicystis sp.]